MRKLIGTIGFVVLSHACYGGAANMNDEVLQVIRNYENSVNKPDSKLWLSIWNLEYEDLTILENDQPRKLGKGYVEHIAGWMKTAEPAKRQTWHTNQAIALGSDLAYTVSLRTEHDKPPGQKESRISMVLRKTGGDWKIIHCHFSFVPKS